MAKDSAIEWTDHTFNPWWGCIEVSPACTNCYARTFDKRIGGHHWGPPEHTPRRFFGEQHWAEPLKWNAKAEREGTSPRVFCASMADVFEFGTHELLAARTKLWNLIRATPALTWMLLTKRPENVMDMVPWHDAERWPANVWIGTTVESQEYADLRIPHLLKVPAPVRFLSCEPLLGTVDLANIRHGDFVTDALLGESAIHWVIVGGESGAHARPMHPDWARSLRDQCQAAGVAFFFKQWGEWKSADGPKGPYDFLDGGHPSDTYIDRSGQPIPASRQPSPYFDYKVRRYGTKAAGRLLDGREWSEFPMSATPMTGGV